MLLAIIALVIGVFLGAFGFAVAYCKGFFETNLSKYDLNILMYSDDWKELQEAKKEQDKVDKEYNAYISVHVCDLDKLKELEQKLKDLKNQLPVQDENSDADTDTDTNTNNNMNSVINKIDQQKNSCKFSRKAVDNIAVRMTSSKIRCSMASIAWGKHFV